MPFGNVKKRINQNEKDLVKHFINKRNKSKAALAVYDVNPKYASGLANQVLKRPHVQDYLSQQLARSGLAIEDLNSYSKTLIDRNLEGKPSQAVAASMVQFTYKLHNALPANKSVNAHINLRDQTGSLDYSSLKDTLQTIGRQTEAILKELEGEK